MTPPKGQQCSARGCCNRQYSRGLCAGHFRQQFVQRPAGAIYETGSARPDEVEITDGRMRWWVTAELWQRRGLVVFRRGGA